MTELKTKLEALKAKQAEPSTAQQIFQTELEIKNVERQAIKEQAEKTQTERTKLRAQNVFETTIQTKCNRCGKPAEVSQAEETLRNHARQIVLTAQCFNPKCASTPESSANLDLSKPLLFVILPLSHGGRFRTAMDDR